MPQRGLLILVGVSATLGLQTTRSCFQDAEISFAGFSEMRHVIQSLESEMPCKIKHSSNLSQSLLGHQNICSGWNNVRHKFTKLAHGIRPSS